MTFPESFSVISDEVTQEPAVLGRFLSDYRLPGFELRSMFGRAFKDLTDEDVARIRAFAREGSWRVVGCSTPVFKCDLDDDKAVRDHIDLFKRCLEIAHTLECDLLRVFTFLRKPPGSVDAPLERAAGHLRTLVDLAGGSGVRVGVENENSCFVGTGREIIGLLSHLADTPAGIIWDPCNLLYVPGYNGSVTSDFASFAHRVVHIHVKDAIRQTPSAGELCAASAPLNAGEVGWETHLREIAECGYTGLLSLETHWRKVSLAEEMLHLPAGHAFSQGGDEASRICMDTLRDLAGSLSGTAAS